MDQSSLESILADVHLTTIRYLDRIDSTNDEAWRWIEAGAPDRALVIADEQTAGRGRSGRYWITPPEAGLAFSLILRSLPVEKQFLPRLNGLGALAARSAIKEQYGLPAEIKWPNDVLINLCKVAGVLVETRWRGDELEAAVVGIGINIAPESVRALNHLLPGVDFPATSLENALGYPVNRVELLHATLQVMLNTWLPLLSQTAFIQEWEAALAFRNQWVEISPRTPTDHLRSLTQGGSSPLENLVGKVLGLTGEGSLKLVTGDGRQVSVAAGEVHMRPYLADRPPLPVV